MHGTYHPAGCAETLFHWVKCIVWDGTLHPGYCPYSWDDDSLLEYSAHGHYYAQPTLDCPDYEIVVSVSTAVVAARMAKHSSGTDTPPPVEILLDSVNGNPP